MMAIHKRVEIKIGRHSYDVHLNEFDARFFAIGSVYCEVIPSVNIAKTALAKCSEQLSIKDKRMYAAALETIVAIICPRGKWVEISKIKKEYKLI